MAYFPLSLLPAAAIYDSKDDPRDKVSDVIDDDTINNNRRNDGSNDDRSNVDEETEDTVFLCAVWDIMNRAGRKVGMAAIEDRRFRSFFGARFDIVRMVWDMLGEGGLLVVGGCTCPFQEGPQTCP